MTQQHTITPPPELVEKVSLEAIAAFPDDECGAVEVDEARDEYIANFFTQWGANQELEACCEWVSQWCGKWPDGTRPEDELRATRRPKPPSLKQQALAALEFVVKFCKEGDYETIRCALEQLPDEITP
jgi:hypothetical protein